MQAPVSKLCAAQVMRMPFQPEYMNLITTVLDARHGAAYWRTVASLEAALVNGQDLIAAYPYAFGEEQVFIVTHFNELRKIFGKI